MTATMDREQAEAASQGSYGTKQGSGASDSSSGACDAEQGCSIDKNFFNRKRNKRDESRLNIDDEKGRETRRKFVHRARVVLVVGLALSWLTELSGEALSNRSRNLRREFISDSMLWDLQNGGLAIGVYPSSRNDIQARWRRVALNDQRLWHDEDNARAFNWLVLMALSAGAGYLLVAPKGKVIVENYIENGVPEQVIKRL